MNAVKHILRWILYATGAVLLGLLVVAGMTQTQFFRDRLRSFALAQLDSVLIADVALGGIDGNLVTGFSINGITLSLHGDTLIHADQISLRYDLFALPGRSISVHDLVLYHPRIHLTRSLAGRWYFRPNHRVHCHSAA